MGMHRSGTSALARLLNLMGVHLEGHLIPPAKDINSQGFWEYQAVSEFNESILTTLGQDWYDINPIPKSEWWTTKEFKGKKKDLKNLLKSIVSTSHRNYVIKDPRLCLVYPFWDEVINELGWQHHCFLITRDPREVALSLLKRDGLSIDTSYLLWKKYMESAISSLNYAPHLTLPFEALHENPVAIAGLIERNLADLGVLLDTGAIKQIEDEISSSLKHHTAMDLTHTAFEEKLKEVHQTCLKQISPSAATRSEITLRLTEANSFLNKTFYENLNSKLVHNAINARKITIDVGNELTYAREVIAERDKQLEENWTKTNQMECQNKSMQATCDKLEKQIKDLKNEALARHSHSEEEIRLLRERLYSIQSNIKIVIIADYFASLSKELYLFIRAQAKYFKSLLQKQMD